MSEPGDLQNTRDPRHVMQVFTQTIYKTTTLLVRRIYLKDHSASHGTSLIKFSSQFMNQQAENMTGHEVILSDSFLISTPRHISQLPVKMPYL